MKEYAILRQIENGCPWHTVTYRTYSEAQYILFQLIDDLDYKRKPFFVDNDFFQNKYILGLPNQQYFQIQERDVTEWVKAKEFQNFYSNNLIKFPKSY